MKRLEEISRRDRDDARRMEEQRVGDLRRMEDAKKDDLRRAEEARKDDLRREEAASLQRDLMMLLLWQQVPSSEPLLRSAQVAHQTAPPSYPVSYPGSTQRK